MQCCNTGTILRNYKYQVLINLHLNHISISNLKIYLQGQVIAKRNLLQRPGVPENIKSFYFNLQGFNQYGLLHDDCLNETEIVKEAISRLSLQMQVK